VHVIETYFECGGFHHAFVQGGTSFYLWNLSRQLVRAGHRVSIVTPAHGRLDDLRDIGPLEQLDYVDTHTIPLALDPATWGRSFPAVVHLEVTTTAHRLQLAGVDLFFLSNEVLDQLPDRFYPPYETKGRDLIFFKPLVYQVDTVRFVRALFEGERAVVHAHEPYYHYLMPLALGGDTSKRFVSTIQSNMPITKSEYRPLVQGALAALDITAQLPPPEPPPAVDLLAMVQYQQRTHLHYSYPADHVRVYDLVADHADAIGYLCKGHQRFLTTFADTPFERLFNRLPVASTIRRNAGKGFVAGCAIGDAWTSGTPPHNARDAVLRAIGMDPALPVFFHNARYAPHHKGQVELVRAVGQALDEGIEASFVLRCLSDGGIDDARFHDLAKRHPSRVHLEWWRVEDWRIHDYTAAADFCLFPSKFEMDTFLIAMGEAMACGAVPVATAQEGMSHFGHVPEPLANPLPPGATGFAVNRSFAEDDDLLVQALADRMQAAARLFSDDPQRYAQLSANAVATARRFTWERCANQHVEAFERLWDGPSDLDVETRLEMGWLDTVTEDERTKHLDAFKRQALRRGDLAAYARCGAVSASDAQALLGNATARGDVDAALAITGAFPGIDPELTDALRTRARIRHGKLRYRLPGLARAELVLFSHDQAPRSQPTVLPLVPAEDAFEVHLPSDAREPLHVLLTLQSGRQTWDVLNGG